MENYIYLPTQTWKQIYLLLKFKKWTLARISAEIGTDFRNALYKGHGMQIECFKKLEILVGYDSKSNKSIDWNQRPKLHIELQASKISA